jgi:Icc-related predicted phosphoesterase
VTKITFLSDTHNKHLEVDKHIPASDIYIHSGDFTLTGTPEEALNFIKWYEKLQGINILVAGNHDFCMESKEPSVMKAISKSSIVYLQDASFQVGDLKIYGSPWQPKFLDWAFNRSFPERMELFKTIPKDVDILVTHAPPYGTLDVLERGEHVGDEALERTMLENSISPILHSFGHIHSSYGYIRKRGTMYVNACNLDERYLYRNPPITVIIEDKVVKEVS